jgi:hypothetical protein
MVNHDTIFLHEIDSIIDPLLFNIKDRAIESIIEQRLLKDEAKKQGLTINTLKNKIAENLSIKERNQKLQRYLDSLKQTAIIKKFIVPNYFKSVDASKLVSNSLQPKGLFPVYTIFDYQCPHCRQTIDTIFRLVDHYKEVSFHVVYHSDYINKCALFAQACSNQNQFREAFQWLFMESNSFLDDSSYYIKAENFGLDMQQFDYDYHDENILKELVANRDSLIHWGVTRLPCFIVEKDLLIEGNPIEYLSMIIDQKLRKFNITQIQ